MVTTTTTITITMVVGVVQVVPGPWKLDQN
jgi:hypothetical protein